MSNEHVERQLERAIDAVLTKRGLAPELKLSPRTLEVWMAKGWIPYFKLGKSVRFRLRDVLEKLGQFRVN